MSLSIQSSGKHGAEKLPAVPGDEALPAVVVKDLRVGLAGQLDHHVRAVQVAEQPAAVLSLGCQSKRLVAQAGGAKAGDARKSLR